MVRVATNHFFSQNYPKYEILPQPPGPLPVAGGRLKRYPAATRFLHPANPQYEIQTQPPSPGWSGTLQQRSMRQRSVQA